MTSAARSVLVVAESYLDIAVALDPRRPTQRATSRLGGSGFAIASVTAESGLPTVLATRVGQDADGSGAATSLSGAPYELALVRDPKRPTGRRTLLAADGNAGPSAVSLSTGAAGALYVADVPRAVLARSRHVHISGFLFAHGGARTAARRLIGRAHEYGCTVSVHPESQWLPAGAKAADFLQQIAGVDLLISSRRWAADALAPTVGQDVALVDLGRSLLSFAPSVVLSDGLAKATFVASASTESTEIAAPGHVVAADPSPRHESVFIGSFLGTYVAGRSLAYCLTEALAAAGRADLTAT